VNSGDLIGHILQSGMARGAGPRMHAGMQSQPGLGGLLGGLLGGGGMGSSGMGGGLGGLAGMLGGGGGMGGGGLGGLAGAADQYLGGSRGMPGGYSNGAGSYSSGMGGLGGSMGGLGGLVGSMLGGGRSSGALGGAAMGVIGMIAMNALRNMGQSSSAPQAHTPSAAQTEPVTPDDVPAPSEQTQKVMLMAMIAAAKADGHIDDTEMNNIVGKLKESGASSNERDWVLAELAKPLDVEAVVAAVPNIEVGAQVYTASVLAITADTPEEKAYLDQLASRLGLQPEARSYIDKSLGMPIEG
jgi:uncharacterized membrane protein YebE (DUF533 family)